MQFDCGKATAALKSSLAQQVRSALAEDSSDNDISAQALTDKTVSASVISHDAGVLCGTLWFDEVFTQISDTTIVTWLVADGEPIAYKQQLCTVTGNAQDLLRGERCALNFLQSLSATATTAAAFVNRVKSAQPAKQVAVMDTRKTLPGLRHAQKYAAACGGVINQRQSLADGILLKENHLRAYGSIAVAVKKVRAQHPNLPIEVETENIAEVQAALGADADIIMLDNFSLAEINAAVELIANQAEIEVSGNVTLDNIAALAKTGVDRISVGAITKHIHALDMSMRFS